jgi:RNA polymerase sigma-70 factor (ECF subfamily)
MREDVSSGRSSVDGFEQFYEGSYRRLYRQLVLVTGDIGDCEDVLAEAYVSAARDWERVRRLDRPEAWVRRVALNGAFDLHRREQRRRRAYARLSPPLAQVEAVSLEVLDAVRRLPAREREVLVLHHLLGETVESISDLVGRPSGTVKGELVRARAAMRLSLRLEESAP